MATQSIPETRQVVPIPEARVQPLPQITQAALSYVATLRQQLDETKAKLTEAEASVKEALAQGVPVQHGTLKAVLKVVERRTVAWKEVVVRKLGEAYAKRVLAATRPTKFTRLIVSA